MCPLFKKHHPKRGPKKSNNKVPPASLPRIKVLPRELLPLVGKGSLKSSIDNALFEFRNTQETLPSISFLTDNPNLTLQSPLEFFTISGEPEGYFAKLNGKFKDISGVHEIPVFLKRVHLVDPIPTMEGLYSLPNDGALPQMKEYWENTISKIHDKYNEAYVDSLCSATVSRLVENATSPHWCRFYGAFNGRVKTYLYNITGEISSLKNERWFKKNQKDGKFKIRVVGEDLEQKPMVQIVEEGGEIECDILENEIIDIKMVEENNDSSNTSCSDSCDCVSQTPSTDDEESVEILEERPVRIIKIDENSEDSSEGSEGSEGSGSSEGSSNQSDENKTEDSDYYSQDVTENQAEFFAEFSDFPVQVTLMERCTNTMDALLDIEEVTEDAALLKTKDARWSAWIYQVIAALTVAQYYYGFVHNDLHTNNVMWTETKEEYIYYRLTGLDKDNTKDKFYRVPTYGKLMKIIDFGRASFWLKDRNDLIITDSFAEGNDAAGQYNCQPYYDPSEHRVNPNPSFDLCRLAVSMFDALYSEQPPLEDVPEKLSEEAGRVTFETESKLYNMLWLWLTDSEGKNILRNPDDTERFPDFDLYKHIARYANNCVPREQAHAAYFEAQYKIDETKIPADTKIWELPLE
jgi:hypothetical protein